MRPTETTARQRNNRRALAALGAFLLVGVAMQDAPSVEVATGFPIGPADRQELAVALGVTEARVAQAAEQGVGAFLAFVIEGAIAHTRP
ncbi:hypothetical protein HHL28_04440 [Aerophototrophica crusticola]|uniref:Uncharacterized protein n=1 Tax=Aerophototrophica crusticola TaxID=1709002 RepID=A0A858R4W7_9PROT|nr:hypothetical protein HHL28_04440 [Rhodospirillaceae bacterium B3]